LHRRASANAHYSSEQFIQHLKPGWHAKPDLFAEQSTARCHGLRPWGFRMAGRSFSFRSLDRVGTFSEVSPQGQSVVKSAGRWIFTTADGTQLTVVAADTERSFEFPKGDLESIRYPSGLEVKIHYREGRISVVSRNDGFALKYFYESVLGRTGVPENYVRPNRIVAFNSTVDYCNPAAATCSGGNFVRDRSADELCRVAGQCNIVDVP